MGPSRCSIQAFSVGVLLLKVWMAVAAVWYHRTADSGATQASRLHTPAWHYVHAVPNAVYRAYLTTQTELNRKSLLTPLLYHDTGVVAS